MSCMSYVAMGTTFMVNNFRAVAWEIKEEAEDQKRWRRQFINQT